MLSAASISCTDGARRTVLEELEMQINAAVYPPGTSIELKDLLIWAEEGMTANILIYSSLWSGGGTEPQRR